MAKDVITRFKLETTGFDSKIKEAAKELSAYSKTATQAKEGFNQFTKANVDAAKALGTISTSTTNAKDRAKELVGAFNEAAKAYNSLTKEQQQSDWAKALSGSLTQLQQRIKETKQEMQGLGDSMKGGGGGIFSGLGSKMSGAIQVFAGNMMTKAASMGVGLVTEMADAVKQGIELAKAGEGVRIAFERLGRGDILQGLREATHGTVTDLELMKAAVKFNDFKLPVEELGTMLAFAQQKAKDTGQSVDYMVDSIVTGLGRKSLMILDNLGLSATEIKEKMKQTGDMTKAVGAIIREQMASAGEYVETAADRAAQANVSLQNKMEELGRKFAPIEEASNQLWTSIKIGILDIVGGPLATLLNQLTEAGRLKNAITNMNGGGNGSPTRVDRMISMLGDGQGARARNTYNQQIKAFDDKIGQQKFRIASLNDNDAITRGLKQKAETELKALQALKAEYISRAKDIMQPVNFNVNTQQAETNVKKLRQQLKELEEQRKKAVKAGDQEQVENLTKQISQVKTNIGYLDPKANKTGSSTKTEQTELQQNQTKINALTQEYVKLGDESTDAARERQAEIRKEIELLQQRNGLLGLRAEQAQGRLTLGAGDFQRDGLNKTPGTLLKAPTTAVYEDGVMTEKAVPRGGLQLDDKAMKAVQKNIDDSLPKAEKAEKKESPMEGGKKMLNAISQLTGGLQQMGIELPSEIQGVIGVIQGAMQVIEAVSTIIGVTQTVALTSNTAAMISLEAALWANTATSFFPFANGGVVPGFANGGVIDSGHSPAFLSFSKAAPSHYATGGIITKYATGGVIPHFANGGTIDAGHSPAFLSFSKAAPSHYATGGIITKYATGGVIPHFANGGTIDAGHSPAFLSFSKAAPRKFATGGTIPHANGGYFVGGTHYSSDVTPIMANAGELILNKVQQNTLAGMLSTNEGIGNLNLTATIKGEQIRLALNNNGRRTGRGEYVQSYNRV